MVADTVNLLCFNSKYRFFIPTLPSPPTSSNVGKLSIFDPYLLFPLSPWLRNRKYASLTVVCVGMLICLCFHVYYSTCVGAYQRP